MLPTITEHFPPLPLREVIELVQSFSAFSTPQKKVAIRRLIDVHPTVSLEWGRDWRYRRARRLSGSELPVGVDQLIWQKGVPAALGRANPEGFRVIYLADRTDTALTEARVTHDTVVIAEFAIQPGHSIRIASIGELVQTHRTGRGFLSSEVSDIVNRMLNACSHNDARSILITDAFLLNCFVGHDDYDISSYLALCLFEKNPNVSGIAFPSRRHSSGINFAIRVETFWNDWALAAARHATAQHLAFGYFQLDNIKCVDGVFHNGELHWRDAPINEGVGLYLSPMYVP